MTVAAAPPADAAALPSRRAGTLGLAVLAAATFVGVSTELLPIGLLPQISGDLRVSQATAGLAVTGYALVVALSATPLTAATARWPRRRLLLTVLCVYAVSNALAALAPGFGVLLAARATGGLCHGVYWSVIAGYAARLVPPDQTGRATSAVFTGNALAVAVGLPLATATGQAFGWRTAALAAAALTTVVGVAARFLLPPLDASRPDHRGSGHRAGSVRAALAERGVRVVVAVTGLVILGHYVFFSYVSVYLRDRGVPGGAVGAALLAYGVSGVVGTVLVGRAYDRRPGPTFAATTGVLLTALAALAVLAAVGTAPWVAPSAVAAVAVLGAAAISLPVALQAEVLDSAGSAPDAASSLFVAAFNLGISGGALVGAGLLTVTGSAGLPPVALLLAAAGALLAARAAYGGDGPPAGVGDEERVQDSARAHDEGADR